MSSYYNSADRIIRQAMRNAGWLQRGDDPTPEDYAEYHPVLNDMIGTWTTQGLKLWKNEDTAVPLVAGKATYTLGPGGDVDIVRPLRVDNNLAYYLDTSSVRRPLIALSQQEYTRLSQVTQNGSINSFFFDAKIPLAKVSFWLVPDSNAATGTAQLILRIPITYVSNLLDTMDFPQQWFLALHWGLADLICTGQPAIIMQRCKQNAEQYRRMLEDFDVEEAPTFFTPDQRMQQNRSSFR